jgi:hypothetical protein
MKTQQCLVFLLLILSTIQISAQSAHNELSKGQDPLFNLFTTTELHFHTSNFSFLANMIMGSDDTSQESTDTNGIIGASFEGGIGFRVVDMLTIAPQFGMGLHSGGGKDDDHTAKYAQTSLAAFFLWPESDTYFRAQYGRLLHLGKGFPTGDYYRFAVGFLWRGEKSRGEIYGELGISCADDNGKWTNNEDDYIGLEATLGLNISVLKRFKKKESSVKIN